MHRPKEQSGGWTSGLYLPGQVVNVHPVMIRPGGQLTGQSACVIIFTVLWTSDSWHLRALSPKGLDHAPSWDRGGPMA